MSIKQQAAKGIMWNAIERFSTQGIQFVLTIIIARILSPDDYGLVAMLGVFMAIAQVFVDSGFANALIQKKERTEIDYSTTFYFNIAIACFVYFLLFLFAPLIAKFYNQPELVDVARIYGVLLITNSFSVVQMARFTITMDFKRMAYASLLSVAVGGGVGVWMAYQGYGVWALVFQALSGSLVWGTGLWLLARWMPKWCFSWISFCSLFTFGSKLLASNLLHTLYTNIYSLVVGKYYATSVLGYFNRAYTLGQFPVQNFGAIIQKVLYPIQCRCQDEEGMFNQIFVIYLRISGFVLFPFMIGLAVLAAPIVSLLLTDKWLPMVPLLQIICLAMMWFPMIQANVLVLDAKGRSDYHLQSEIIKKAIAVLVLFSTIHSGIKGICIGMLIYSLIDLLITIAYSRKLTAIGYKSQFKIIAPIFILSTGMGIIVHWIISGIDSTIHKLLVGTVSGIFFYFALAYLLKFRELRILLSFMKKNNAFDKNMIQ